MSLDWESRGVLADFRRCQRASQNTDLVFHCTNGNVSAHQMIFAGISPLFADLMQRYLVGQELFPLDLNISLPEILREHMEMVVEMVYTGQVRITKRDYEPFREICQLLDLSVPIADYDKFFRIQCDDNQHVERSRDTVHHSQTRMSQVSIPKISWSSPRIFVCGECYAVFPLKIALNKHKQSQHAPTESLAASDPPPSPIESEPTTDAQLKTQSSRQRSSNRNRNLICPSNDERKVKCPDCQKVFALKKVRKHLAFHLRNPLNELATKRKSESGIFKCELCPYETRYLCNIRCHIALAHDTITKFANEAQMKFLNEARTLIYEAKRHSYGKRKLLSRKRKQIQETKTRKRVKESEDFSEMEDSDVETGMENTLEDKSQALYEPPDVLNPPMLSRFNRRVGSSIKNKTFKKKTRVVKCPDCHSPILATRVRDHLVTHLRAHLIKLVRKSDSVPGMIKCPFCSFESNVSRSVCYHLGWKHEMMMKYANAAQKKFIDDAEKLLLQKGPKRGKKKKPMRPKTKNKTLENAVMTGMEANDPEIGINKGQEDATETDSVQNHELAVQCPDCLKNYRPPQVSRHLATHLREQLDDFMIRSETVPVGFKCKSCSYESSEHDSMLRHLGVTHKMVETFANEAQKKFLHDGQKLKINESP